MLSNFLRTETKEEKGGGNDFSSLPSSYGEVRGEIPLLPLFLLPRANAKLFVQTSCGDASRMRRRRRRGKEGIIIIVLFLLIRTNIAKYEERLEFP